MQHSRASGLSSPVPTNDEQHPHTWPIAWQGECIWAGLPPVPTPPISLSVSGVPVAAWNRYCYLRKMWTLDTVPTNAWARVTADSRFILYVNGVEAARGPARAVPERLAYASVDLAPYLKQGKNVISTLVGYYGRPMPWWIPPFTTYQLGLGSFMFEAPTLGVVSDTSWKGYAAPYRSLAPDPTDLSRQIAGPPEIIDGRHLPWGWNELAYDDTPWEAATILQGGFISKFSSHLPVAPFTAPEHVDLAPATAHLVTLHPLASYAVSAPITDDPVLAYDEVIKDVAQESEQCSDHTLTTYDAGHIVLATPWIELRGTPGTIVDVYAGEDVKPDGMVEIQPRMYVMRCILGGQGIDGVERFEGFHAVGFRYLAVAIHGTATIQALGAIERHYPRSNEATFSCDDERLNRIWQVGARTLDLCALDSFVDCPGREQRAWVGDSYIHALLTYTTATDWRLARRHLQLCAQSRHGDGLLSMVAAGDFSLGSPNIPDYSLHWIRALARYLEYSGDTETVRDLLPTATDIVTAFERYRREDGLLHNVPNWIFIDWAMTERAEITGALDALYATALLDYAWLLDTLVGEGQGAEARTKVEHIRAAFTLLWDETRGVYVDAADANGPHRRVSQHTNALAILSGCAPKHQWSRMLDYILDEQRLVITPLSSMGALAIVAQAKDPAEYMPFNPETQVVGAQPFFSHFVHQAVVQAGRYDLLQPLCLRWNAQIERGNSTFEEFWDGPDGKTSRTHAWSATPTYDLTAHILGVRPLAPGFARAEIRPYFGSLHQLKGRIPTPFGLIELDLTPQGGTVTLPEGVSATLHFPDCELVGGELRAGQHIV